jgi:hypothetical protein
MPLPGRVSTISPGATWISRSQAWRTLFFEINHDRARPKRLRRRDRAVLRHDIATGRRRWKQDRDGQLGLVRAEPEIAQNFQDLGIGMKLRNVGISECVISEVDKFPSEIHDLLDVVRGHFSDIRDQVAESFGPAADRGSLLREIDRLISRDFPGDSQAFDLAEIHISGGDQCGADSIKGDLFHRATGRDQRQDQNWTQEKFGFSHRALSNGFPARPAIST